MNEKSLNTLEFPKVVAALSAHTSFSASRELAEGLRPSTEIAEVQRAQAETSEARRLLELRPDTTVAGARDVRPAVDRAELGSILDPTEFLPIVSTIISARSLRRQISKLHETDGGLPLLAGLASRTYDLAELEEVIRRSISESGDVMDGASPALGRIRNELRQAHDRLQQLLRSILSSSAYAQAIQEPIITVRDGRYVIPVKSDFRGRLPGIVHDTSGSGQTLFVEPLGAVEAGNRWRELQGREADEVERILRELGNRVADHADELRATVAALARIDFALAKARYANRLDAVQPQLLAVDDVPRGEPAIRLPEARHPLLKGKVVPISLELGGAYRVLVVTGPNTGGKTVALKTVGLLTLMAQSGLHLPAQPGARVAVMTEVFADIGDEQSIEQSLSTFSSHISKIVAMLQSVDRRSLVLLDELGAGTDPEEGSALARAILDFLLERRSFVVATTHYSELKSYAHTTPGVRNASVEFDVETLSPTYRLVVGLPGRSNALAISGRLGMPREILERAEAKVDPQSRELNDMLQQIQDERVAAVAERSAVQHELAQARRTADEARIALLQAEEERANATDEGRRQAQQELEEFRREIATLRRELQGVRAQPEAATAAVREAEERVRALADRTRARTRTRTRRIPSPPTRAIGPGDTVIVQSLGSTGRVLSLSDGTAELQMGRLKMRVPTTELQLTDAPAQEQRPTRQPRMEFARPAPPMELDLRGKRADEVIQELDRTVDDAYLAGMPMLRIIHGKGTGALRGVVRDFLKDHPLVEKLEGGGSAQGGEGVTIASLAQR